MVLSKDHFDVLQDGSGSAMIFNASSTLKGLWSYPEVAPLMNYR